MRIYSKLIIKLLIYIALFIAMGVQFVILPRESIHMNTTRLIVFILGVISYIFVIINPKERKDPLIVFANRYSWMVITICVFFMFYSMWNYGYSFYTVFLEALPYLYIVYSVPIVEIIRDDKNYIKVQKEILWMVLFFLLLRFISWYNMNYTSSSFLTGFATEYGVWIRAGKYRLIPGTLFGVGFVFAIEKYLYLKKTTSRLIISEKISNKHITKTFILISIGLMILFYMFVTQVRYGTVVLVVTYVFSVFLIDNKNLSRIKYIILIITCAIMLFVSGFVDNYIDSFSIHGDYGNSTLTRIEGIYHFYKLFIAKGHMIGLGFPVNRYGTENLFYRNTWSSFYLNDLGILDAIFRFGIFVIPIYFIPFVKSISLSITKLTKNKQMTSCIHEMIIIPTMIYMILTCLLSNIYQDNSAFSMAFFVAFISVIDGNKN